MPSLRFYDIAGDPSHKALGFETFSPEEAQEYEKALVVTVPEGSQLTVRARRLKSGRRELILGVTKLGQPLRLVGEDDGADPKENPPPAVPRGLEVPTNVLEATDADLEVMAARNGITVDEKWKRKNRSLRNAEVAKKLQERKAQAAGK